MPFSWKVLRCLFILWRMYLCRSFWIFAIVILQALLYRLSGDYNPLHSDPMIAKVAGLVHLNSHVFCFLTVNKSSVTWSRKSYCYSIWYCLEESCKWEAILLQTAWCTNVYLICVQFFSPIGVKTEGKWFRFTWISSLRLWYFDDHLYNGINIWSIRQLNVVQLYLYMLKCLHVILDSDVMHFPCPKILPTNIAWAVHPGVRS